MLTPEELPIAYERVVETVTAVPDASRETLLAELVLLLAARADSLPELDDLLRAALALRPSPLSRAISTKAVRSTIDLTTEVPR